MIAVRNGWDGGREGDHVHLLLEYPPKVTPELATHRFKRFGLARAGICADNK